MIMMPEQHEQIERINKSALSLLDLANKHDLPDDIRASIESLNDLTEFSYLWSKYGTPSTGN
jgi:hypothetical protein